MNRSLQETHLKEVFHVCFYSSIDDLEQEPDAVDVRMLDVKVSQTDVMVILSPFSRQEKSLTWFVLEG